MNYLTMFKSRLIDMNQNGSWIAGFAFTIPTWVLTKHDILPNAYHEILAGALMIVIVLDWLAGSELARKSHKMDKTSGAAIDSIIRDCMIILCIILAYLADYLLGTGSIFYAIFTFAFIWQNFISVMANVYVLGWEKHFPMWLVNLINNEIVHKIKKYIKEDLHEKNK